MIVAPGRTQLEMVAEPFQGGAFGQQVHVYYDDAGALRELVFYLNGTATVEGSQGQ